ncbi:MAG TPA: hypothetical protein VEQ85_01580, partial [Lacipirellulaceae bacterium]|nr:hypothetical protein [Lacipirellulaceae bacterium]
YLLSEVIGQALLSESEISLGVNLTDQRDMLPLGLLRPEPVVHVQPSGARRAEEPRGPAQAAGFELAGACVTAADATPCSHAALERLLAPLALHVDLCEPFGRIVSALSEAQMAPADSTEAAHGPAAAA